MNKLKVTIRNIFWIALVAVWSFVAGAYFHLGWIKKTSMSYEQGFFMGGIAMWLVFFGIGIFVYRYLKKNNSSDPSKSALIVVSFFTACFMLIAWIKYDDVKKDKFIDEATALFVLHYAEKAKAQNISVKDIDFELELLFQHICYDLESDPKLEQLMQLKSENDLFEKDRTIYNQCKEALMSYDEKDSPFAKELKLLFE